MDSGPAGPSVGKSFLFYLKVFSCSFESLYGARRKWKLKSTSPYDVSSPGERSLKIRPKYNTVFRSHSYSYPHQVSKVNSLWRNRTM